ncbi:hypothetical protein BIY22_01350 [Vibrio panuliri]|uniref:ABC transporter permease n=2 Tax=Vibrio panuliri TaxID=1381081 RepID=A0A1Q9HRY6_9VIBR|nr:hypothetical protein BIY22_01350 [Vibrio panuliri]OLQ95129.1 hypothetical protein BIY20_07005 [Vibrio panuliri]
MLSRPYEILHVRILAIAIVLTLLLLTVVQGEHFLTATNFQSMAFQSVELGILSLAMCIAIVLAGIDLSIIAIANLAAIAVATYLKSAEVEVLSIAHLLVCVGIACAVGVICGALNGYLIGYLGVPAILATLATMTLYGGLAIGYTGGAAISGMPQGFDVIGNGQWFGVPIPMLIFLVILALLWRMFETTVFGTHLYCVGANPKASQYSGIPVAKVLLKAHTLIGVLAAIAGLIILSRTNSANPVYGSSYILSTILIVALGGVSVLGGKGKILGVAMAIVLLQLFSTGLNMLLYKTSGSNFLKDVIWGVLLLAIIVMMHYLLNRGNRT